MSRIEERLDSAISLAQKASAEECPYPFLPEILASLEGMRAAERAGHKLSHERRSGMAGALERLVTEDMGFSESQLGQTILEVSDYFARQGAE